MSFQRSFFGSVCPALCRGPAITIVCLVAAAAAVRAETIVVDDPLVGSTKGELVGGTLGQEGYTPGIGPNHVLYRLPVPVKEGVITVDVKGFDGKGDDNGFVAMYDGRGIPEPAIFEAGIDEGFRPFRENFFRWNIHWRDGERFKAVLIVASPERASSVDPKTMAASYWRPVSGPPSPRDFTTEPNGTGHQWKPAAWETLRIEWKKAGGEMRFSVSMAGRQVWGPVSAPAGWEYHPREHRIWLGSGPGPMKYESKSATTTFRNFRLVALADGVPPLRPSDKADAGAQEPGSGGAGGSAPRPDSPRDAGGAGVGGGTEGGGGRAGGGGTAGMVAPDDADRDDGDDHESGEGRGGSAGGSSGTKSRTSKASGCEVGGEEPAPLAPFLVMFVIAALRLGRGLRSSVCVLGVAVTVLLGCSASSEHTRRATGSDDGLSDEGAGGTNAGGPAGLGGTRASGTSNAGAGGGGGRVVAAGGAGGSPSGSGAGGSGGVLDGPDAGAPMKRPRPAGAFFFDDFEAGFDESHWQNIWTTDWWVPSWVVAAPGKGTEGSGALWFNTVLPMGPRQRDVLASYGKMALWGLEVAPQMKPRNVDIIERLMADGTMKGGLAPLEGKQRFTLEMDLKFAADNRNRAGFLFRSSKAIPYPSGDFLNAYAHVIQYDGYAFVVSNHLFDATAMCDGKVPQGPVAAESNVFIVKRPKATMDDRHNDLPYTLIARAQHPIAADQWIRLRLEVDGTKFKGYVDGKLVIEGADASGEYADRFHVGIHGYKHQRGNGWDCYTGTLLTSFWADNFTVYDGIPSTR